MAAPIFQRPPIHEVLILAPIKHGLSHLSLLDVACLGSKSPNFGLVEHVVLLDAGEHLLDSGVVCGLEHDSGLSVIHLVYA